MNASTQLDALVDAGVRVKRDREDLIVDVLPGATLDPYRDDIRLHKSALLAELRLREQMVSAASAAQDSFDRQHFDELWHRWAELQEEAPA